MRDVPADRNAAWVYVDAINAYVAPPRELRGAYDAAVGGSWPDGDEGVQLADWLVKNQAALDLTRRATEMPDY